MPLGPKIFIANTLMICKASFSDDSLCDRHDWPNPYLSLLFAPEFGKDRSDSLALGVPDGAQTVPSVRPNHETGNVRNDEP